MKLGIAKKIIGVGLIGFAVFFIFAIFSYTSINSFISIHKKNSELAVKIEVAADLQILMHKILMPPNDYLITGDRKERADFSEIVSEAASVFAKYKITADKTDDEVAIENKVEKGFIELQQKAMVLLSTENPVGNKEAAVLMKEMDAKGESVSEDIEKFHDLIRGEIDTYSKRISYLTGWVYNILIALILVSILGVGLMILIAYRSVVKPLITLTNSAKIIGQGNLSHKIEIYTKDEFEILSSEFNKMSDSLKEKMDQVEDYSKKLEKTNRQLDQNILQIYTLYSISKIMTATLGIDQLLHQVVEKVSQALRLNRISIMLLSDDKNEINIVAGMGIPEETKNMSLRVSECIYGFIVETGQAEIINDVSKHPRYVSIAGLDDNVSSMICVPFKSRNQVIGIINAYRIEGETFGKDDFELLTTVSSQVGIALENVMLFEKTKFLSITDGMTELYNYRYLTACLNTEVERTKRYKRPLSLIMIDVDFFKKYNDSNGHPMGDKLLVKIAGIFKNIVRKAETVARYGGEEFVIMLPETGEEMAYAMAERLRKTIEATEFDGAETQPGGKVTVSIGVATFFEEQDKSWEDLVKRVDNALYRAKEEGRNRVSV